MTILARIVVAPASYFSFVKLDFAQNPNQRTRVADMAFLVSWARFLVGLAFALCVGLSLDEIKVSPNFVSF